MAKPPGLSNTLMNIGVIEMRKDPVRLVTFVNTYKHPTKNISVTVAPVPKIANPSFWPRAYYGWHNKVDKILVEDGCFPVAQGTPGAMLNSMAQFVSPFYAHVPIVPPDAMSKYEGLKNRDPVETRLAYHSTIANLDPPVDPRGRRAVEHLEESVAEGTNVALPWNIYHVVYFRHKLKDLGYELTNSEDVTIITQNEILKLMTVLTFLTIVLSYYTLKVTASSLFGSWF